MNGDDASDWHDTARDASSRRLRRGAPGRHAPTEHADGTEHVDGTEHADGRSTPTGRRTPTDGARRRGGAGWGKCLPADRLAQLVRARPWCLEERAARLRPLQLARKVQVARLADHAEAFCVGLRLRRQAGRQQHRTCKALGDDAACSTRRRAARSALNHPKSAVSNVTNGLPRAPPSPPPFKLSHRRRRRRRVALGKLRVMVIDRTGYRLLDPSGNPGWRSKGHNNPAWLQCQAWGPRDRPTKAQQRLPLGCPYSPHLIHRPWRRLAKRVRRVLLRVVRRVTLPSPPLPARRRHRHRCVRRAPPERHRPGAAASAKRLCGPSSETWSARRWRRRRRARCAAASRPACRGLRSTRTCSAQLALVEPLSA